MTESQGYADYAEQDLSPPLTLALDDVLSALAGATVFVAITGAVLLLAVLSVPILH